MRYHHWFHNQQERIPTKMSPATINTFGTQTTLAVGAQQYEIFRLDALERDRVGPVSRLPFSLKVLLENLLRHEDGRFVHPEDIEALAKWQPNAARKKKSHSCPRACSFRTSPACPR